MAPPTLPAGVKGTTFASVSVSVSPVGGAAASSLLEWDEGGRA